MKRLHHQSDAVAIWVKETKRQGRIAHHHADATVPHIVALLGFSFHAAKIQTISKICKFLANFFIIRYSPRKKYASVVACSYPCSHGDRHLGMGTCFHGIFFAIFLMVS